MKVFFEIPYLTSPSMVAIGNFDGLHLGHRRIIEAMKQRAWYLRREALVFTFHPHPDLFFGGKLPLITPLSLKLAALKELGVDTVIVAPFDARLASLPAADFVKEILKERLRVSEVFFGEGFRFGRGREGDVSLMLSLGRYYCFSVWELKKLRDREGRVISSTLIREALSEGDVEQAWQWLGRPYYIGGVVIKGWGLARKLGFPTLNLAALNEILPRGVFAGLVRYRNKLFPAAVYIGTRPTYGGNQVVVEAHILGSELRAEEGEEAGVYLLKKIREERKFDSEEKLRDQIRKDIKRIKEDFQNLRLI